jgi:uncharacterized membrane protein
MRSPNVLVVALIVSVVINLALAGFVVGRLTAAGPAPPMLDPYLGSLRALHVLPDDRAATLRPLLREHFRGLRPDVREMRRAQSGINQALATDPFDPAQLDEALAAFRAVLLQSQERSHQALIQLAGSLTTEERAALREALTRGPRAPGEHYRIIRPRGDLPGPPGR